MKKVLVVSDTHDSGIDALRRALLSEQGISAIVYLGDGVGDMETVAREHKGLRVYAVSGNCDLHTFEPREALVAFENVIVFYTHGHLYDVKYTRDTILRTAKSRKARVCLFGHTHNAMCEDIGGVLLFNPGACKCAYGAPQTYGVLTFEDGAVIDAQIKEIPQQ